MKVLAAWLGNTDLKIARSGVKDPVGPIAQALAADKYDLLLLLVNQPTKDRKEYVSWLNNVAPIDIEIFTAKLPDPTDFSRIYRNALEALKQLTKKGREKANLTFHLSPGTPAMGAVWIILGSTQYPAALIQSSDKQGVKNANVPFDISAEFVPGLRMSADKKRQDLSVEKASSSSTFGDIIYRSEEMALVVHRAKKVALRNLYVLIEGESGTGKELLAAAIHNNSPRAKNPFVVINCGAVPSELVESEFFGHKKGSFTGADFDRKGAFEKANTGTLFLDEIGDLPLNAQVKLLRSLQEGEIKPVGATEPLAVDVRIIAATNKNLKSEVAAGRFREDLFYRLNIVPLKLPALRDRKGDLGLLTEKLLEKVNNESQSDPGYKSKKISPAAKNLILRHRWSGNVRELLNTLRRVTLFAESERIAGKEMLEAIEPAIKNHGANDNILNRDISEGINLQEVIKDVASYYLKNSLKEAGNNKSKAAKILGLQNYQTLDNWLKKYAVKS
jgi:transcriptional regulator with PAS, ATPase and Fis domain